MGFHWTGESCTLNAVQFHLVFLFLFNYLFLQKRRSQHYFLSSTTRLKEINCLMRVWKATQLERINTDILLCLHNQAIIKMKRLTCFPNSVSFYIISQNDTRHLRHLYRVDHSKSNCGIMPSLLHTSTVNMGLFIKLGSICSSVHEIATLGRLIIYSTKGII